MWLLPFLLALCICTPGCADSLEAPVPWLGRKIRGLREEMRKFDDYLVIAMDCLGGEDGICQFHCVSGATPQRRFGFRQPPANGCGSPAFGLHLDVRIPAMTRCCNHHDACYDSCGVNKAQCDAEFLQCLNHICSDIRQAIGLTSSLSACESGVQLVRQAVLRLGCKPYLDSQRAACSCPGEEKDEL